MGTSINTQHARGVKLAELRRASSGSWISQNILPVVALFLTLLGLIFGPIFGAAVAVVGNYVANETRSAVTETKLNAIQEDVKSVRQDLRSVVEQMQKKEKSDGKTETKLIEHDKRLDEIAMDNKARDERIKNLEAWRMSLGGGQGNRGGK